MAAHSSVLAWRTPWTEEPGGLCPWCRKELDRLKWLRILVHILEGFAGGASGKSPPANAGDATDTGSIPGSGRSLGVGNNNLLQYSCLDNSMD